MKKNFKVIVFYLILIAVILVAVFSLFGKSSTKKDLKLSEIEQYFKQDKVYSYTIKEGQNLTLTLYKTDSDEVLTPEEASVIAESKAFETKTYKLYSLSVFFEYCEDDINACQNIINYDVVPQTELPWWVSYIPTIIFGLLIIGFWIFTMRQMNGQGGKFNTFGKAKTKSNQGKDKKTFADVAGADEEKEELVEIVEFLKDPHKFSRLGARIPHGVLLVGPPGTGKTLLAKAVAGEADVPFFSISGSDFVEMYVGVGASRVRDLFENARKSPAAIIFIDEIDAVGRHRGAGLGGGHDEREQTLNQLLVEMDGFGSHEGIIVMAATNRPDILDPALLRPGRFDRQVTVGLPDIKGREEILKVHSRNKPMENAVDYHRIAQTTIGFSGADLANLMNESALLAAKKGKSLIGMEDIEASFMKLLMGPQKKSKVRTEADNKLTAFHEAGHAVATYFCKHTDPVKFISIIPAGNAGGVTVSIPEVDKMCETKNQMFEHIILALGGRVAEELVLEDISTGASSDIQQATKIARAMVTRYGMSEKLGTVLWGNEHSDSEVFLGRDFSSGKSYSEKTASEIDDEIKAIIEKAYQQCKDIISANLDKLNLVANYLLHAEYMDGDQFKYAMENSDATIEALDEIENEKKRKSEEENRNKQKADQEEDEKTKAELRRELEERKKMEDAPFGTTFYDNDDKDNK